MSAYSASPPVTTRKTEPSTRKPSHPLRRKNSRPCSGFTASITSGWRTIWRTPSTASTVNQSRVIGPNTFPTRAVPVRCTAKIATRMTTVMGRM